MFKKSEGVDIPDIFNANKYYAVGFYTTMNMKNVYKYSVAAYHCTYAGGITPIKDSRKRFKLREEAYEFYLSLMDRYRNIKG